MAETAIQSEWVKSRKLLEELRALQAQRSVNGLPPSPELNDAILQQSQVVDFRQKQMVVSPPGYPDVADLPPAGGSSFPLPERNPRRVAPQAAPAAAVAAPVPAVAAASAPSSPRDTLGGATGLPAEKVQEAVAGWRLPSSEVAMPAPQQVAPQADPWAEFRTAPAKSADPWAEFRQPADTKASRSWADVPGEAINNMAGSAAKLAENMVQPFLHPVDTARNLADVGAGAIRAGARAVLPAPVFSAAFDSPVGAEARQRSDAAAAAVGQFFKDRYGGAEQIKRTLATDPVGAMADAATVLTGGGALAARGPGIVGRVGEVAQAAGSAIDPIANAGRAAALGGRGMASVLGATTGVGTRPIQEAFSAGRAGNTAFTDAMRGNTTAREIVDMADNAVGQMTRERSDAYTAGMAAANASQKTVDVGPLDAALRNARDMVYFKGVPKSQDAARILDQIEETVQAFKQAPGPYNATHADALKQAIGEIQQKTQQGTLERKVSALAYNALKNAIVKQVPDYADTMRRYQQASDQIGEMRRALSINDRASIDTTARKLLSTLRNNVNTNFGAREALIDDLATREPDLVPALAGVSMNSGMPRGLARLGIPSMLGMAASHMDPTALAVLPFQSPRLVGEATYAAGRGVGAVDNALAMAPAAMQPYMTPNVLRNALLSGYVMNALAGAQR